VIDQDMVHRSRNGTIASVVDESVREYLNTLAGESVSDLYELVLAEVEAPLLARVLDHTGHNQSRAASMLGLNRGTLRKKLRKYGLL